MPIAKVTQGPDAYRCLNYVLTKDEAEFLETNCATDQPAALSHEFKLAFDPHLRKGPHWHTRNYVSHFSIGFHAPQSRETLIEVAHRFMALMGFDPVFNQYVLAQHHDTDDCHVHLVMNRIRLDGDVVSDSFQKRRAEVAMRTIETEFGFPPLKCSWEVDIKAPTVSEVRRSRKSGEPIPRQAMQAILEQTVSGCRTLEALQTALQAEGVTLIQTPTLPDAVPRQSKRQGKRKGKTKDTPTGALETGEERGNETDHKVSDDIFDDNRLELEGLRGQSSEAGTPSPEPYPTPLPSPHTDSQTPPPTRYQLVYQWTATNGKVATFSASALGKRYTQRGLQDRWGIGLQGRDWVEWAVQQSVKSLFTDQLTDRSAISQDICLPTVSVEPDRVETVEPGMAHQAESQTEALTGVPITPTADPNLITGPEPTAKQPLTPSQQVVREYYQNLWLQLEQAYTQTTGHTRDTEPRFDVQVLGQAQSRWALDQCIAMLATTPQGQAHAQQGRTAFTAYVQGLFDQLPTVKREAEKPEQER